jgi:hypothetical protein
MADAGTEPVAPTTKPWSGGGREELADAVRRLMTGTVTATAPPEVLADDTPARAEALADELEDHVPEHRGSPPPASPTTRWGPSEIDTLAAAMPFDVVIGSCNPVALPVVIEFEPPKAIGRAVFTPPYEGAPGCVHGAAWPGHSTSC